MKLRSRSKYLKAADLAGREVTVRMDYVEYETLRGQDDDQPVLYFLDDTKQLILNAINERTIKSAFGDETDDWHGGSIVLFPTTTQFGSEIVPCIRIRIPAPVSATPPVAVAPSAEDGLTAIVAPADDVPF